MAGWPKYYKHGTVDRSFRIAVDADKMLSKFAKDNGISRNAAVSKLIMLYYNKSPALA